MKRVLAAIALTAAVTVAGSAAHAFGRGGGGSQSGDSWLNDAQRNPRFIEPGAQYDPSRYRSSHPQEGWNDRQRNAYGASERGYYGRRYGY